MIVDEQIKELAERRRTLERMAELERSAGIDFSEEAAQFGGGNWR